MNVFTRHKIYLIVVPLEEHVFRRRGALADIVAVEATNEDQHLLQEVVVPGNSD